MAAINPEIIVSSIQIIDPILALLVKRTGSDLVPFGLLKSSIPTSASLPGQCVSDAIKPVDKNNGTTRYNAGLTVISSIPELARRGVLRLEIREEKDEIDHDWIGNYENNTSNHFIGANSDEYSKDLFVGFPLPPDQCSDSSKISSKKKSNIKQKIPQLHGSTKAAGKRRLAALKKSLKLNPVIMVGEQDNQLKKEKHSGSVFCDEEKRQLEKISVIDREKNLVIENDLYSPGLIERSINVAKDSCSIKALQSLQQLFQRCAGKSRILSDNMPHLRILPNQASYAGCQPQRQTRHGVISPEMKKIIPTEIVDAFSINLDNGKNDGRKLFAHQSEAIRSALTNTHTLVCTGTGSGKSLCFIIPVLTSAMYSGSTSFLIFPTKALTQDQFVKLHHVLASSGLQDKIRLGVIDGDTPHYERTKIVESCNIVLTNPDTLHAAMLPNWKTTYRTLFSKLKYVVMDEAHVYEGTFGTHVSLVLSRLVRICSVAKEQEDYITSSKATGQDIRPIFLACSATITHPEAHFRNLCPIPNEAEISILSAEDDGSPCGAKHFFVWNPPLTTIGGKSTGTVFVQDCEKTKLNNDDVKHRPKKRKHSSFVNESDTFNCFNDAGVKVDLVKTKYDVNNIGTTFTANPVTDFVRRRHPADETAILLATALENNVRCIAFCKTRSLVEWVYDRCVSRLRSNPSTSHLTSKVESYRGGYSAGTRHDIERRLFQNQLLGVVGTSALELGIDIGGIDLTLHCGYPGSIHSLLQQSGRGGRGNGSLSDKEFASSFSIIVCFNSPAEQHMWRNPSSILFRNERTSSRREIENDSSSSLLLNSGILRGHLLCASSEFPLTGADSVRVLTGQASNNIQAGNNPSYMSDHDLFGSSDTYTHALQNLLDKTLVRKESHILSCEINDSKNMNVAPHQKPFRLGGDIAKIENTNNQQHKSSGVFMSFSAHPAVENPWTLVSMRSVEPLSYSIVDVSQNNGCKDKVVHKSAIIDTIPYSRVFYYAFPGAVIRHRGRKYEIIAMDQPPTVLESYGLWNGSKLAAYAKPITKLQYLTRALSLLKITVVKRLQSVDHMEENNDASTSIRNRHTKSACLNISPDVSSNVFDTIVAKNPLSIGSIGGNGVVNIKRTVHGFAKISPVTRIEISRTEIAMPPMEFDTNGIWLDTEAPVLSPLLEGLDLDYHAGVHALSHAIMAIAPLFVSGCTQSDIDCDHGYRDCSRIMIFDVRAGGGGVCSQLWRHLFSNDIRNSGVLEAAIDVLENCESCSRSQSDVGCPACLHSIPCMNFNQGLSRKSGSVIAKRLLQRVKSTKYSQYCCAGQRASDDGHFIDEYGEGKDRETVGATNASEEKTTPRKLRRRKNFQNAFDLESAKKRHIVIGRPCWPGSENSMFNADEIQEANVNTKLFTDYDLSEEGGFMNQAS